MGVAFFDIDGTLLAKPSLERRLVWHLQRSGKIPAANYFAWLAQAVRLGLRDMGFMLHANKKYLQGVTADLVFMHAANENSALPLSAMPEFFPAAVQRVWWHALRGDLIVLVSGTIEPLAEIVKHALQRELLWRGVDAKISVLATQLELREGRSTGRVAGIAMLGEEKARAAREFAGARTISLLQCSAYADSALDRWMLACVGHPFAVNSTRRLRRIARRNGWQMLEWTHCPIRTAGEQRALKWRREAAR